MSLATVAAIAGTAAAGYSIYNSATADRGGGGSGGGSYSPYVPTGLGSSDQAFQQMLQQIMGGAGNIGGTVSPAAMQAFQQLMGIDTQPMLNAGQHMGDYYGSLATSQDTYHNMLVDSAWRDYARQNNLQGAGDQLWQTALDPNNALHDRLQNQVGQQSRAGTTLRGIGMSPQAADMETQATDRFNQDWQDRLLGRQAQGLQGMTGAYNMANLTGQLGGQDLTGASNLATAAAQNIGQSALAPYQMQQQMYGAPFNYANMLTGAQGGINQLYGNAMGQIVPYLYAGQGATDQGYGQQQANMENLTRGLGQLGKSPFLQNLWTPQPMNSQNTLGTNQNIFAGNGYTFDQPYG